MSKKVNSTGASEEMKQEKVMTKYDLKMQRREEAKKQAARDEKMSTFLGIALVVAIFAFVISFPIRTYLTVNSTFVKIGGADVSRVEFDYQYNLTKTNYIEQYSYYMSMFGVDLSGDLSTMMYSDTLTWEDFFQKMTVESLSRNKALQAAAETENFTYDASEDYKDFLVAVKEAAKEQGVSERDFIANNYGQYATLSRIKPYIMQDFVISAYYKKISDEKAPTEEEIKKYYEENTDNYDSVDYRLITVTAELPTEPTDLADPAAESAEATDEETKYTPSAAEVEFAMKNAYAEAQNKQKVVKTEGDLREGAKSASMISYISDWAFDETRKAGDTAILENTTGNCYYVVAFEKRYLEESPSKDARIVLTYGDADAILAEWKSGEATEDSFAALADKYNDASMTNAKGGLYEGLLEDSVPVGMDSWLFDETRKPGDATVIKDESDVEEGEAALSYVVYYVGDNNPEWMLNIKNTLLSNTLSDYLAEIGAKFPVEDPKGNLHYLKVEAAEAAAAEAEE